MGDGPEADGEIAALPPPPTEVGCNERCGDCDSVKRCTLFGYRSGQIFSFLACILACLFAILVFAAVLSAWGIGARDDKHTSTLATSTFATTTFATTTLPTTATLNAYDPLDPFTAAEANAAIRFLTTTVIPASSSSSDTYFNPQNGDQLASFYEQDPPKASVLAWSPSSPPLPRAFYFCVIKGGAVWTGRLSLSSATVQSWQQIDTLSRGGPPLTDAECSVATSLPLQSLEFLSALLARQVNPSRVKCLCNPWGAPWNKTDAALERDPLARLVHVNCLSLDGAATTNAWYHPIVGLGAVVDVTRGQVVRVYNDLASAVPTVPPAGGSDFDEAALAAAFPSKTSVSEFEMTQPEGKGYRISGNTVEWQSWRLHVKPHPRAGVVISKCGFKSSSSSSNYRSILYQIHASEIFIPYQSDSWNFGTLTAEEVGEFGLGRSKVSMALGDCPPYATLRSATTVLSNGTVLEWPNAYCIFERPSQFPAWRHGGDDGVPRSSNARAMTELVVRVWIPTLSFDYLLDYVFSPRGGINVQTTITGVHQPQPVAAAHVDAASRFSSLNGVLLTSQRLAVFHSHFINFRIDIDPEEPSPNQFVKEVILKKRLPSDAPSGRSSVWGVREIKCGGEKDALGIPSLQTPGIWNFRHSTKTTALGNPMGYKLVPGIMGLPLVDDDDPSMVRAAFTRYPLWVTPQRDDELWAAGEFVYQSPGRDGLGAWTAANRTILDQDIVAWYTVGFHHLARQEEFPVIPSMTASFFIMPENFFESNPALSLP